MTKEELKTLYARYILPESKQPFHFEEQENNWQNAIVAYNPVCGDKYKIAWSPTREVDLFNGIGCAVSKASTSLLLRSLEGKSIDESRKLINDFLNAFSKSERLTFEDERLNVLLELRNFGGRIDCIQLSWKAVKGFLEKNSI